MEQHRPLHTRLAFRRTAMAGHAAPYDQMIDRLRSSGALSGAPVVGDVFADFVLPDSGGTWHRLGDLLAQGPAVVSFNRGSWCPFCTDEVAAWSGHRAALTDRGARLIVVTPETGGRAGSLAELAGPGAVVLCDVDLGVALQCGLAVPIGAAVQAAYDAARFDLGASYGGVTGFLPVPATFLLDPDRTVRFVFADPDFRSRAEPGDVIATLP